MSIHDRATPRDDVRRIHVRAASRAALVVMLLACGVPQQYDLVIHDVAVLDLESGESQVYDLGIVDDRIAMISSSPLRGGSQEFDAAGLWAIPGLWDMHVHISDPSFFDLMISNGVVGARDMGGDAPAPTDGCESVRIETLLAWREEILSGKRLGPRLWLAGPVATGNSIPGRPIAVTPEGARQAVAEAVARGSDFIKVYENIPPAAYDALMDEASRRGIPVAGHVSEETLTIMEAIDHGQRSIEHVRSHLLVCFPATEIELTQFFDANDWTADGRAWGMEHRSRCPQIWEELRRGGTWLTPTLAVERTHFDGEAPGFEYDPRRETLPSSIRQSVQAFSGGLRARSAEERAEAASWWIAQLAFVARARAEGAPMLAGSDAACEGVIPGHGLHDQLRLLVEAGLTPLEALRTATSEPAAYFDREMDRGRIATGAEADLVLLRADPSQDIESLTEIVAVVVGGRFVGGAELEALRLRGLASLRN